MFSIGQKFESSYPPDAAIWCNENGAMIVQVDGGFEIQACPSPTAHELSTALRSQRDAKLSATDKYLLADYPISPEEFVAIKTYRQLLRDLPAQPGAPWDGGGELTPWPELPSVG